MLVLSHTLYVNRANKIVVDCKCILEYFSYISTFFAYVHVLDVADSYLTVRLPTKSVEKYENKLEEISPINRCFISLHNA